MAADGPFFNRQLSAGQSARMVHFNSAFYNVTDVVESVPPAPSNLSATATHNTVTLSWRAPDDETVTGYRILRRGPGQTEFEVHVTDTPNTENQYTDTVDVNPDTGYEYTVQAINTAGVGPASNAATVQTPAAP